MLNRGLSCDITECTITDDDNNTNFYSWNGRNDIIVEIATKSIVATNRVIERELPLD